MTEQNDISAYLRAIGSRGGSKQTAKQRETRRAQMAAINARRAAKLAAKKLHPPADSK